MWKPRNFLWFWKVWMRHQSVQRLEERYIHLWWGVLGVVLFLFLSNDRYAAFIHIQHSSTSDSSSKTHSLEKKKKIIIWNLGCKEIVGY